jgi:hypothetical protein
LACPKCSRISVYEYETVVTRQEISKCAVDKDSIGLIDLGISRGGRIKKRWWQK